jgi:outer membrane protein TolC
MENSSMKRLVTLTIAFALALPGCSTALLGENRSAYRRYTDIQPMAVIHRASTSEGPALRLPLEPTADDYLSVVLSRNPKLKRARGEAEAAGYEIAQVTSLPDPLLSIVPPTGELTETAAGQVDSAAGVSQKIPFPGKLYARGQVASHAAAVAYEAYRGTLFQLVADVRRAYYMLYFADRSIELTSKSRDLLRDFRNIALRKYEVGNVPQQDVLRAQVELANLENELVIVRQRRDTARARLNSLMAYRVDQTLPPTKPIEPKMIEVELDTLLNMAAVENPEIAAAKERIERARASLTLAKLEYVPDLTVGYQYVDIADSGLSPVANGDDNWQLNLGVTLPIWFGRLSAGHNEATVLLRSSREALVDVENTTAFRIQEAILKVETEQRLVELFGKVIIPQAQQTLDATVSAYRAGQVDFLTFIENWRRLLDFEISYEKSLSSFEQELAELERLVGKPLEATNEKTRVDS